jgi:hypothetical protein
MISLRINKLPQEILQIPVTNYEYEEKVENDKRNIFLLKPRYLNIVFDDMEEIMAIQKRIHSVCE